MHVSGCFRAVLGCDIIKKDRARSGRTFGFGKDYSNLDFGLGLELEF